MILNLITGKEGNRKKKNLFYYHCFFPFPDIVMLRGKTIKIIYMASQRKKHIKREKRRKEKDATNYSQNVPGEP